MTKDYRDKVVRLINERKGEPLMNGSIDDAAIITQEALSHAKDTVRILSHQLNPDCYAREAVRNAAKYFLADPDHKLRILIEASLWDVNSNFEWSKHPLIKDLLEFATGEDPNTRRLAIRLVPKAWVERYKFNFLLLDDYGFRYEADRKSSAAVAKFYPENTKQRLKSLQSNFDILWEASADLVLH